MSAQASGTCRYLRVLLAVAILAAVAATVIAVLTARTQGFRPPIRLSEVEQISYGYSDGGPAPMEQRDMTIWVRPRDAPGPSISSGDTIVASKSVTVTRPGSRGKDKVYVFTAEVSQERVAQLVSLLNQARIWTMPLAASSVVDAPGHSVSVRLIRRDVVRSFSSGPFGESRRAHVAEEWEFTTASPPTNRAFSELIDELDAMTRERK